MTDTRNGTLALARYYAKVGDRPAALDHLQRSLEQGLSGANLKTVTEFATLAGDPQFEEIHKVATQREIDRVRESIALDPDAAGLHARLGLAFIRIEDWAGAVEPYEKACELAETQGRCATYAIALQRAGREAEALAAVEA